MQINANGRPYMGPHLNITPPGPMTSLHQSGQGTLDSGIVCINGFIEIVMLRRLPERHKQNALAVLYGQDKSTIPNLYASVSARSSNVCTRFLQAEFSSYLCLFAL